MSQIALARHRLRWADLLYVEGQSSSSSRSPEEEEFIQNLCTSEGIAKEVGLLAAPCGGGAEGGGGTL